MVNFHTANDPDRQLYEADDLDYEANLPEQWYSSIQRFGKLTNLRTASLNFSLECKGLVWDEDAECPEMPEFRKPIFEAFMSSLENIGTLEAISIANLQGIHKTGKYRSTLARIERLALLVATEDDEANEQMTPHIQDTHTFFNVGLKQHWLQPMQANLTQLSLCGARVYWGWYPCCDLRDIHFPRLRHLALGKMSFTHDWQVDWITSHGATLQTLILDTCSIVIGCSGEGCGTDRAAPNYLTKTYNEANALPWVYEAHWADYLQRLKCEPPKLQHFGFPGQIMPDTHRFRDIWSLPVELGMWRYVGFQDGGAKDGGGLIWDDAPPYPDCDEEDQRSLNELLIAVKAQRRRSSET